MGEGDLGIIGDRVSKVWKILVEAAVDSLFQLVQSIQID